MTDQAQGLREWLSTWDGSLPESFTDYRAKLERLKFQNETLASLHTLLTERRNQ